MNVVKNIFVTLAVVATLQPASLANGVPGIIGRRVGITAPSLTDIEYDKSVLRRLQANLQMIGSSEAKTKSAVIFHIEKDGAISNVTFFPSGTLNADLAAVEAVLSSSPLPAPPKTKDLDYYNGAPGRLDFGEPIVDQAVKVFYSGHPELKGNVELLHLLPTDILNRYPGVCDAKEIFGCDNLMPVKVKDVRRPSNKVEALSATEFLQGTELSSFFEEWNRFFRTHPITTRSELFAEAARLRKLYFSEEQSGGARPPL